MNAERIQRYRSFPLAFLADLIIPSVSGAARFADVWAPFQRETFIKLAPALLAVARGEKPAIGRVWVERTKGGSKDSDLACCLLWLLAFTERPLTCQAGAADLDQADELRKAARDILRLNPWLQSRVEILNWKILCDATGATCDILAADVAGSHGSRPDVLIVNELSHITRQEFAENLRDNAAKVAGLVIIATNAGELDSWQWKWRELARNSKRWFFHRLAEPSPWLAAEEIDEAEQRNSPSRFNRLFKGVWATPGGDALDPETLARCVVNYVYPMREPFVGWSFVGGADFSATRDHSAVSILGINGNRIRVAWSRRWVPVNGKIDLVNIRDVIRALQVRYRPLSWHFDPYEGRLMAQELKSSGLNIVLQNFQGTNAAVMASTLLTAVNSGTLEIPAAEPELLRDLRSMSIVEKSGVMRITADRSQRGHCDQGFSMVVALPSAQEISNSGYSGSIAEMMPTAREHPTFLSMQPRRHGILLGGERRHASAGIRFVGGSLNQGAPRWESYFMPMR